MRFLLHKNDVGNTTGFMFYVGAATFDANGNPTSSDVAPDGDAYWTYDLSVHPMIGVPTAMPAKAVAGKKLTVTFPVTRADNGQPLTTTATIAADVTVAGKAVAHTESLANGLGKVTLTVPKTAKGKTLAVKVTITVGDQTATRVATFKVVKK